MNASTGAFSNFAWNSDFAGCMAATTRNQQIGVTSNSSATSYFAFNFCDIYNSAGTAINPNSWGADNLFTVPGACNDLWTIAWVDVFGPPHYKKLSLLKYDATNPNALTYTITVYKIVQ